MKKIAVALILLTLMACGTLQPMTPLEAQCDYEAEVAVQGIQNEFEHGWQRAKLKSMCIRVRSGQQ